MMIELTHGGQSSVGNLVVDRYLDRIVIRYLVRIRDGSNDSSRGISWVQNAFKSNEST